MPPKKPIFNVLFKMEKRPPATSRLALLLQNPDLLSMNFDYQNVREAFMELSVQLDEAHRALAAFAQAESKFLKVSDMEKRTPISPLSLIALTVNPPTSPPKSGTSGSFMTSKSKNCAPKSTVTYQP